MSLFFETIRALNGTFHHLMFHQRRLDHTQRHHFGTAGTIDLVHHLPSPPDEGLYRCKVLYDTTIRGIHFFPYTPRSPRSFTVIQSDIRYPFKHVDRRAIDHLVSRKGTADDIIIADANGCVKDTSIANIAIRKGGLWLTPRNPLFCGTTRERLIEAGWLIEKEIITEDLKHLEGFAVMNAMIDFVIVKDPYFMFANFGYT